MTDPVLIVGAGATGFTSGGRTMTYADTQVLFCDLQPQIIARSRTNPPEALAGAAAVLARVTCILGLPMTFSMVPESGSAPELIAELQAFASPQTLFTRVSASPFLDHATARVMRAYGRKTLVIAGFATEVVSLHAALGAIGEGYAVQLPVDANGGLSARSEDAAFRQIEHAGGVITSVATLATTLAPDFATSPGREVFAELEAIRLS